MKKNLSDPDPLFTKFLHAGYSRVIVPVQPGMENYAALFCGYEYWMNDENPNDIPGVDSESYLSIAQEIADAEGLVETEGKVIDHYIQKVPTNLVYIVPNEYEEGTAWPGLPDNREDDNIADPAKFP